MFNSKGTARRGSERMDSKERKGVKGGNASEKKLMLGRSPCMQQEGRRNLPGTSRETPKRASKSVVWGNLA